MVARKKSAAAKRLSDAQIYALAERYENDKQEIGVLEKDAKQAQVKITDEMARRKTKTMSRTDDGLTVTFVQNEAVVIDDDGLRKDLKPSQVRRAFDENVNLNALPPETRKKIIASLDADERAEATTLSLNPDRLSQAVQAGKIDAKLVAKHSSIKKSAPYIRISRGSGK